MAAAVLGSKNADLLPLATERLSTRGTKVFGLANHEGISRQPWGNTRKLLNETVRAVPVPIAIMMTQ